MSFVYYKMSENRSSAKQTKINVFAAELRFSVT